MSPLAVTPLREQRTALMAVLFLILALGLREGQPATSFEEELA
jgi:hypothetical protein